MVGHLTSTLENKLFCQKRIFFVEGKVVEKLWIFIISAKRKENCMVGHLTYTLEKNCFAKKEYFLWKEKLWRNSGSLLFLLKEKRTAW
jgi:hypothetical protein